MKNQFDTIAHSLNLDISSAKADRNHAQFQLENGIGDKSYWRKEIVKANGRIAKAEYRLNRLQAGQGFKLGDYVIGLITLAN